MNCKPGDLAVVIRDSMAGVGGLALMELPTAGMVVRVLKLVPDEYLTSKIGWQVEQPCYSGSVRIRTIEDWLLRPIPPESDVEMFDAEKELQCKR